MMVHTMTVSCKNKGMLNTSSDECEIMLSVIG